MFKGIAKFIFFGCVASFAVFCYFISFMMYIINSYTETMGISWESFLEYKLDDDEIAVCESEDDCEFDNNEPASKGFMSKWDTVVMSQGYHFGHRAVDLTGPDKPYRVRASHDGIVSIKMFRAGSCYRAGRIIRYDEYPNLCITNEKFKTCYLHMENIEVEDGQAVRQFDNLGTMGNLGCSTGPHLHYTIFEKNKRGVFGVVNPLKGYLDL